jgi:hypothetical protein
MIMPINFNLLRQSGPTNLYEGFVQGQEEQRVNAMAQQNAMMDREAAQQKMAQDQEMNALRMQQVRGAIGQQEREVKSQAAAQKTSMFRERLLRARDPNSVRELIKMQYADPDVGAVLSQGGSLEQALAEVPDDPTQFEEYRQQEAVGMGKWIESQMKARMPMNVGNAVYIPSTDSFRTPPREATPVAPSAPVAVMGPDGRPQYVSREQAIGMTPFTAPAIKMMGGGAGGAGGGTRAPAMPKAPAGYRYTPTGDLEAIPGGPAAAGPNLTPKDIQKREAALPQARQAVSTVSNTMSVIGETVDRLLANRDGLNGVTGLVGGRTPGITDAARQAQADIDQLKNLAFIQGITELRNASKTGAGVGNVSNKEGDRFENLKASLERTQSYNSMVDALKRLKSQSEFTRQSLKEAFDETYSYRDNAGVERQMTGEDKAALDWANSNPKDPRSAQIKQRLGVK